MQRICKTCKKPLVNIVSNFCSTGCFTNFSEKRQNYLKELIYYENEYGLLTATRKDFLIAVAKTAYDPMENEYQ